MARKPIVQRISLDGGKEIEKQLLALGTAGEKAFRQIAAAAAKADLKRFGDALSKAGSAFGTVVRRVGILTGALGALKLTATGVAAAFFLNSKNAAAYADAVGKAAQKTGIATEAFQELAFAAQMSDVDQGAFIAGVNRLNRSIVKAAGTATKGFRSMGSGWRDMGEAATDGLSEVDDAFWETDEAIERFGTGFIGPSKRAKESLRGTAEGFEQLGIAVRDANNRLRPTEDILADVADRFAAMPDGARKSALAIELFGKSGAALIPFLNEGSAKIRRLGTDLKENGLVLSDEQIKAGDELGDALDNLGGAFKGVRIQMGLLFAPVFTDLAKDFRDAVNANRIAIVEFVREIAVSGIGILRDFFNALRGDPELVRRPWVLAWTEAFLLFGRAVLNVVNTIIIPVFTKIHQAAQFVAESINAIFGTDFTGGELLIGAALLKLLGVFGLVTAAAGVLSAGVTVLGWAFTLLSGIIEGVLVALAAVVGWPALLVAAFIAAGIAIFVFWDEIKAGAAATWEFLTTTATAAWAAIVSIFTEATPAVTEAFSAMAAAIGQVFTDMLATLGTLVDGIGDRIAGAFQKAKDLVTGILTSLVSFAQSKITSLFGVLSRLVDRIGNAIAALKRLVGMGSGGGESTPLASVQGKAHGGYIRGPGGPTSDSIVAMLSNGEFVIRAAAVKKFGAGFFAQLNALKMPRFDAGGIVQGLDRRMASLMPIPHFAAGGLAMAPAGGISGTPVNLNFPGGETFALIAPENIAEKLARFASGQALRSAGRKPGWYR